MTRAERATAVCEILARTYPDAHCELDYTTPLELLVATILSAQCTDKRVNIVTKELFRVCRSAADYVALPPEQLEDLVKTTGFFRAKAKNIRACCAALVERHGGEVPRTMEELHALAGVGRKTANVVLNIAFRQPTIAVDTHLFRVANRTGLAPGETPLEVELRLLKVIPEKYLFHAHHWLILHGRYVCIARKPECYRCIIAEWCRFEPKTPPPKDWDGAPIH